MDAVDHVLRNVLAYTGDIETVTRDFKRVALFKRGEMFAAVCNVLRKADTPLTTREVAERVFDTKGITIASGKQSKDYINRVRHSLKLMGNAARKGTDGKGNVVWSLDN